MACPGCVLCFPPWKKERKCCSKKKRGSRRIVGYSVAPNVSWEAYTMYRKPSSSCSLWNRSAIVIEILAMLRWLTSRKNAWFGFSCMRRLYSENIETINCSASAKTKEGKQKEECLPENLDELSDSHVIWHKKLGLVKQRKILLARKTFDNDGYLVGVQLPDQVRILRPLTCKFKDNNKSLCYHHYLTNSKSMSSN